MIEFKKDDIDAVLILTLTEYVTINDPYYLFVFTHVLTKNILTFIKGSEDDDSNYTSRYNKFSINPSILFFDKPIGEWHYMVYQQSSATNTDIELTDKVLENGKMRLNRATELTFSKYNQATTYTVYNG